MACECSVVVPLHNHAPNLPTLHLRLKATLQRLAIPYEIILVDNGSTDATARIIEDLHRQEPTTKGIVLSRHFSDKAAFFAGLEVASGRAVVTLAPDPQEPPELIPQLIGVWQDGHEVVFTRQRSKRGHLHKAAQALGTRFLRRFCQLAIPLGTGTLMLLDHRVVREFNNLPDRARNPIGLLSWIGFRQTVLEYDKPRIGRSQTQSLRRLLGTLAENIRTFSVWPAKALRWAGLVATAVGIAGLVRSFGFAAGSDAPAVSHALTLLAGVQLLALGAVVRTLPASHPDTTNRPLYVIRERIGFQKSLRPVREIVQFLPSEAANQQEAVTRHRLNRRPGISKPVVASSVISAHKEDNLC